MKMNFIHGTIVCSFLLGWSAGVRADAGNERLQFESAYQDPRYQVRELEMEGLADQALPLSYSLPSSMGALGDSITAGALANYQRKQAPYVAPIFVTQIILSLLTGNMRPMERQDYSWSTGWNPLRPVNSHFHRLRSLTARGHSLRSYNAAFSGAQAQDVLKEQLPDLVEWSQKRLGQAAPDYTTLMVGPNDICAENPSGMTPTADFYRDLSIVVDTMLSQSPSSHIFISSIPNVTELRGVARDARAFGVYPVQTCGDLWRVANVCPTLTSLEDPSGRALVAQRVVEFNEALSELARTRAEQYGDRIRFSGRAYQQNFSADDVSIDCFHPNPIGQNRIAAETWKDTWWAQ